MSQDDRLPNGLWDPAAAPDPDVAAIERQLAGLRFDPAARPLDADRLSPRALPRRPPWRRLLIALPAAAAVLFALGAGVWLWRSSWPEGRAWRLQGAAYSERLEVGRAVTVPPNADVLANVARLGSMRVSGGSTLELRSTRGTRHRLRLTEGDVHVRVWAPPVSVVIETPSGEVIDLGCEFRLSVRGDSASVHVFSGWVQLENGIEETLVPAGASAAMRAAQRPGVAVFDDAPAGFLGDVRAFEASADRDALNRLIAAARQRDVYTLLNLADRHRQSASTLLDRAAQLWPPPDGITIASVLRGDRENLWTWVDSLPLLPLKGSWWRNWRDALPLRLGSR
jgi:hypothetical protein